MKASSFFLAAFLVAAAAVSTQKTRAQFSGGIKAGTGFTTFKTSDDNSMKTKTGFVFGGFAGYSLSHQWGLQAEALYSQQGAKEGNGSYNFNYINIPVTVRYTFFDALHVFTGPQIGFLTSAKISHDGGKEDIKDNVKGSDLTWILGTGYEFRNGLFGDLRFVKGISDISDNYNKTTNTGFQLTVGYRFKHK